jgi:hypothetical protein
LFLNGFISFSLLDQSAYRFIMPHSPSLGNPSIADAGVAFTQVTAEEAFYGVSVVLSSVSPVNSLIKAKFPPQNFPAFLIDNSPTLGLRSRPAMLGIATDCSRNCR